MGANDHHGVTRAYLRQPSAPRPAGADGCCSSSVAPLFESAGYGVAFFDFPHGQTGVAPNAIELHPILGFRCVGDDASSGGRPSSAGVGGGSGGVRLVRVTSLVTAGSDASVTVAVSPPQTCSFTVTARAARRRAAGPYPERALASPGRGWLGRERRRPVADRRLVCRPAGPFRHRSS